jgi:hypothetical protein
MIEEQRKDELADVVYFWKCNPEKKEKERKKEKEKDRDREIERELEERRRGEGLKLNPNYCLKHI